MPVKISQELPAYKHLLGENIFVIGEKRAASQDIRPLKIVIFNLMPNKEQTETQLLRMLGNSPLQIEIVLLRTASYLAKHTSKEHLAAFYRTFNEIENQKFDGMIITGAPVEKLDFEEVAYWDEMEEILAWSQKNVHSKFYICWAAQAALYYLFSVQKHEMEKKLSGIYKHSVLNKRNPLVFGFDDEFDAPHSRYTEVRRDDLEKVENLNILAESKNAGVYLAATEDLRNVFVTGHGEYDTDTLHNEYLRDRAKGINSAFPDNYYQDGTPKSAPVLTWRSHASLLFMNWINTVYQNTPYNIEEIK